MALASFDAVLFDMDGTLIDTESAYLEEWVRAADLQGFELTQDLWHQMLGRPTIDCHRLVQDTFGTGFNLDVFAAEYRARLNERLQEHVPVMPGVLDLLHDLTANGTPLAVATSATRKSAEAYLSTAGLRDFFSHVITRDDVDQGKPHPEPFQKAAAALSVAPERCMAMEDTEAGICSAHGAGAIPIMIPSLKQPADEIAELCHLICNDMREVHKLLRPAL
ncbi:MAG: HAD family hydrolase [Parvibaculum sp.]|jgi:HAD superfamily hydrolase (TIGR01509 family)|nr:HAD family hydrolase [Parvibaculum sp.]|tara:strand:+ start:2593 stop:3255 length:663 start_codon:yes stop_codon:yes gene_type:complete